MLRTPSREGLEIGPAEVLVPGVINDAVGQLILHKGFHIGGIEKGVACFFTHGSQCGQQSAFYLGMLWVVGQIVPFCGIVLEIVKFILGW